jgi:two-component system response regulator GlrR
MAEVDRALALSAGTRESAAWRDGIVTRNPSMLRVLAEARLVAQGDAPVLLTGHRGTGKELLARPIHDASSRRDAPFVALNCGALPEQLLESELFGHVKGAFTGAVREHKGLFQTSHGGTIFLDEVGDMPLGLQVKLLRVLQEREVRPVGSTANIKVDVRVISATHRDLRAEQAAGNFREDLYYRLNVVAVALPSLGDGGRHSAPRRPPSSAPARATSVRSGRSRRMRVAAVAAAWKGNVRQLQNVVEKCVALCATRSCLPASSRALEAPRGPRIVRRRAPLV